jgi:hypothetical protein
MVLKYDDFGAPYREPPYTEEEDFKFWNSIRGAASFPSLNHRPPAAPQSPQDPEQPQLPEETHPS